MKEVTKLWPECYLVHVKPRDSQSRGSVERANQDIENILACWMKNNDTTSWSDGIKFVLWQKNKRYHRGIKRSPYSVMFCEESRLGLTSLNLPNEVLLH